MRLNHLMLTVGNLAQSRDWYVSMLGLKVEFEVPDIKFAALEDESGFTRLTSLSPVAPASVPVLFGAVAVIRTILPCDGWSDLTSSRGMKC
jgi:catechol 2,3-dioxygenase-like lactoylglutathione lyase family enzyme